MEEQDKGREKRKGRGPTEFRSVVPCRGKIRGKGEGKRFYSLISMVLYHVRWRKKEEKRGEERNFDFLGRVLREGRQKRAASTTKQNAVKETRPPPGKKGKKGGNSFPPSGGERLIQEHGLVFFRRQQTREYNKNSPPCTSFPSMLKEKGEDRQE